MSKNRKKTKKHRRGEKHTRNPSMRRWIYLCLALAVVIATGSIIFLPHSKAGPPKISLSETFWNFGRAPQHSNVSHTFWIKNIGGDTLRIIEVKPGWGCTKAPLEKKELAAGDSARLEIIFNSGRATHNVKKSTQIFSNDSTDSITSVWIAADVMPKPDSNFPVQISPNILDFTTADLGESPEIEVKIRNTTISDLGIKIVDTPIEFVESELSSKMLKPSEEVKLKVRLKREAKETSLTKSITLELADQDSSRFTVPVKK